jgi:hypothetical protein
VTKTDVFKHKPFDVVSWNTEGKGVEFMQESSDKNVREGRPFLVNNFVPKLSCTQYPPPEGL